MSKLEKTILQRRGDGASDCAEFAAKDAARALQIRTLSGESWVLPWGHFVSAQHGEADGCEQLALLFTHHEVTLRGVRLAGLLPEIAASRLESVCELPEKFQRQADNAEPFISRLFVRALNSSADGSKTF
ncbi:MAG: hypothetical protein KGJ37_04065 [Verrucomicrobiota bacterium]|nr:hypothetical protein [Verrucomicrobiota bacterium]